MHVIQQCQAEYRGKDVTENYGKGQIKQLQLLEIQSILELLLELKKGAGHEGLGGHLVDVGCGCGDMTKMLAAHFDSTTGIDISPEQIMRAKELYKDTNMKFLVGEAEKLPLKSSSADAITAILAVHYMDANAFTSECLRVLKPGGAAVFWTDFWGGIRSVDGCKPDATHLVQDMNKGMVEYLQKVSHPGLYIYDRNVTQFDEIRVTENKSLRPGKIELVISLADLKNLILSIPIYSGMTEGSPIHNLCKRLKELWKMEDKSEEDIMMRATRVTFPIVIWK